MSKVKIFVLGQLPQQLMQQWLQHLRDFDVEHPGCHFQIMADAEDASMQEMAKALDVHPGFAIRGIIKKDH
jgi:hypothetical protein